jgi:crotonobetainyl-CoA:carnitine CoA-transferase CaiB-like acyl-CoA transferase
MSATGNSAIGEAATLSPAEATAAIWRLGGGALSALDGVALRGREPVLPSSFAVGTLAQATVAASALAAAEFWRLRTGRRQLIAVDMRHAAAEFRSERYLRVEGEAEARIWDKVAGVYQTGDGRYVRVHANMPHHRARTLAFLGADNDRASVAAKLQGWTGEALETAAAENGMVITMMRSPEEWRAHPQGQAIAALPLYEVLRIGDASPRRRVAAGRPMDGIRVLDLTRVIAGPVCGRTLAWHGADVLSVTGPGIPDIPVLVRDGGRGKLRTEIDMAQEAGRETLRGLVREADVFVQGYRPGAIAAKGFAPEQLAELSPGIVCVSLCAWSHAGPWANRRGFDSLVQNANGLNQAEAALAGVEGPRELPCQALDHGTGMLMATGAMMALKRQAEEGGSWLVRVSLAQTGEWLWQLGRNAAWAKAPEQEREAVADLLETTQSGFGAMTAVRHAGLLCETPPRLARPAVPLGTHPAAWPDRSWD